MGRQQAVVAPSTASSRLRSYGHRTNTMYLLRNTNFILTIGERPMDKIIKVRQYSTVICDLDGTIADLTHRLHFIKNADGTKKKYKDSRLGFVPQNLYR